MKTIGQNFGHILKIVAISLTLLLVSGSAFIAGCCSPKQDEPKECNPPKTVCKEDATPEWSYDAPFYVKPVDGLPPLVNFEQEPVEVFTQKPLLQIPRPAVGDFRKAPRIAIWMTNDKGIHWKRIGYFGIQQSYFHYRLKKDGMYGIRFIGPGIPPAKCKPPKPHFNFIVDSVPPLVRVFIDPDQDVYEAGQMITVEWKADDPYLKPDSVKIAICLGPDAHECEWTPIGDSFPCEGTLEIQVPEEAINRKMFVRVTAMDMAENLGHGFSCPITVVSPLEEEMDTTTQPSTQPTTAPATSQPTVSESAGGPQIITTMPQEFPNL